MNQLPDPKAVFGPAVCEALAIALQEVGPIVPVWDEEVACWVFEHPLYPESYGGDTPQEVVAGYPLYLGNLLAARLGGTLAPSVEARIQGIAGSGRGGARAGAGRPKGGPKVAKARVYLPQDMALWIKEEGNLEQVVQLMHKAS